MRHTALDSADIILDPFGLCWSFAENGNFGEGSYENQTNSLAEEEKQ